MNPNAVGTLLHRLYDAGSPEGVKKGAFDEATAQKKFDEWKSAKEQILNSIRTNEEKAKKEANARNLEAEKKANEAMAKKVAEKKAALVAEQSANEETAEVSAEEAPAEA